VDLKALREAQAVIRAERIRNNAGYMQGAGFRQRRFFFCDKVRNRVKCRRREGEGEGLGMKGRRGREGLWLRAQGLGCFRDRVSG